ncbi:phosphotransferase [Dactylosporangium sp. NPDC006015]|uniref:phosphotransferase enzyme family protein n=1 Tax=Dactylosporangium sp. NPDC006015 TaxID=3154576 RepID=UPI0033A3BCB0
MEAAVRWVRSLAAAESVALVVGGRCGLRVTGCELVRSLVNDVYRVDVEGGLVYACKVYAAGKAHVAWEQDLAVHLAEAGVTEAVPVPMEDGALVGEIEAPEGVRQFTVTVWMRGGKPRPPWSGELFFRYGAALARFHEAADGFDSTHPARTYDPVRTLDDALSYIGDPMVHEIAERVRPLLDGIGDVGVRHGDASLDNVHLTDDGRMLWHDFDLAAVGPRGADLTGAYASGHWPAFEAGYASRRRTTGDVRALRVVELVRNIAWHLRDKVELRGTESTAEGWVERELQSLRDLL